jgi:hypothetical protein
MVRLALREMQFLLNAAAAIAAFDGEGDVGIHERISKSLAKSQQRSRFWGNATVA